VNESVVKLEDMASEGEGDGTGREGEEGGEEGKAQAK
jgi:hypothetical protein